MMPFAAMVLTMVVGIPLYAGIGAYVCGYVEEYADAPLPAAFVFAALWPLSVPIAALLHGLTELYWKGRDT